MRRFVKIISRHGEVKKFECSNPDCDEILEMKNDKYERKTNINCPSCHDRITLIRSSDLIIAKKKEKQKKDK